jgi:hypothetical protein
MRNPDDLAHHYPFDKLVSLIEAESLDPYSVPPPVSQQLKAWSKAQSGLLSPSAAQISNLVDQVLGTASAPNEVADALAADVARWFEDKRMQRYLKAEEQQAALLNESSRLHAQTVATQLLDAAASKVCGITSPFGRSECEALLSDSRVDLSPHGPLKVLMERIFENREHIARMLGLDQSAIESMPTAAATARAADGDDDPLLCVECEG